jgi:4-amino-4-deoxy-L-arabinose transferase-like glycosyltransferase
VGLAGDYVDPISKVTAQDEALYAHSAIRAARQGGWLTPIFMGRYGLYKPPLLMWVSGLSARILGVSRLALRLPVALLASLSVCLVFLWPAELRSWQAGACAAALLVSNHLWHVLAGMSMTDGLLVLSTPRPCSVFSPTPGWNPSPRCGASRGRWLPLS